MCNGLFSFTQIYKSSNSVFEPCLFRIFSKVSCIKYGIIPLPSNICIFLVSGSIIFLNFSLCFKLSSAWHSVWAFGA